MIIDCVSDLHGYYPALPGGDILVVAGDLAYTDHLSSYHLFGAWLGKQAYNKIIVVAGNHDGLFQTQGTLPSDNLFECATYLCDSGIEYGGLKIWGSPWTPTFQNWYFMKERGDEIKAKWDLIPDDTEILITHGPPHGILDFVIDYDTGFSKHVGCEELRMAIHFRLKKLKLHIFGHIHERYGCLVSDGVEYVNCSHVDEYYRPKNKPIRVIL